MHRLPRVIMTVLVLAFAYAVWPLYTAMQIRDAMVAGDAATIDRRIEWESVRTSLKASLSRDAIARLEADPETPPPTLWQRVKTAVGGSVAGSVVDRYATPERLPVLLGYRRIWRGTVEAMLGREQPATPLAGTFFAGTAVDRFASFWRTLRSAVFHSPTRLEIEVQDEYTPGRAYQATLELRRFEWKLTRLAVSGL